MQFELVKIFEVSAETLYSCWLDSALHAAMTGEEAEINNELGGNFQAWGGYISGKNLELKPYSYVKQSWRTTEFPDSQPDSIIELFIRPLESGNTEFKLVHSGLTDEDEHYIQGWEEYYFQPMEEFFLTHKK